MKLYRGIVATGILLLGAALSGCAGPAAIFDEAQSHFDFPNGNVVPLGHVTAEVQKVRIVPSSSMPQLIDEATKREVTQKALDQMQGDILIDVTYQVNSKLVPFPILTILISEISVDGQAAKLEIAKQELH